jgi:translation initiation factor IF-2
MPRSAPQPKQGEAPEEKPTTIAGLIGNLFGSSNADAAPASQPVALRGVSNDMTARPKQAAPVRTASAVPSVPAHTASTTPPPAPAPVKPQDIWSTARVAPAAPAPAPVQAAARPEPKPEKKPEPARAAQPEIRTAYSTPAASSGGLLSGAQPVVPTGSFNSFR